MTTAEQFELFCAECNKWIDRYSLNDWEIRFLHTRLNNAHAECRYNLSAQQADLALDLDGLERPETDDNVIRSAHHEVLELLFCEYAVVLQSEYANEKEKQMHMDSARHKIINRLMHHESFIREHIRKLQGDK